MNSPNAGQNNGVMIQSHRRCLPYTQLLLLDKTTDSTQHWQQSTNII